MPKLAEAAADLMFGRARSFNAWIDAAVADETLRTLYDMMKMAPTSANCFPIRIVFVRTDEQKRKLAAAAFDRNAAKILSAPVTAILAYDTRFFEGLPRLFPHNPDMQAMFAANPNLADETAFRNGSLQGAYFILAARAVGLDCGPMSGFDKAAVDAAFFPGGTIKTNFLCSLGHGDPAGNWARLPRPAFDEVCKLI